MFSVVPVDLVTRTLKVTGCFVLAAYILRGAYQLPATSGADMLPELVCVMAAFLLGLTACAIAIHRPDDPYSPPLD